MSGAHEARTHSRLGLSAALRWRNCHASVNALAKLSPKKPNAAMLEGTAAHEWCEFLLNDGRNAAECFGNTISGRVNEKPLTKEMADAVQVYLDTVRACVASDPNAVLLVERKFNLTEIDPDVGGTTDAGVYLPATQTVHGFDYKHGAGNFVETDGNEQLTGYAYGLWQEFRHLGVQRVLITIVQPRCYGEAVRTAEIDVFDLMDWSISADEDAKATRSPDAQFKAGPWCAKTFCELRATCPALRKEADACALDDFGAVVTLADLPPDDLAARRKRLPLLKTYVKALEEYSTAEALAGRLPGFKFVAGRGSRVWVFDKSEQEIAAAIRSVTNGCAPFTQKLITPAAAEKAMGKNFASVAGLVKKSDGKPTLVLSDDKRPALDKQTVRDFEPITEENENT